jgi:hypothetical protein
VALVAAQLAVVVGVAVVEGTSGVAPTIAALLLAPVAVWAVRGLGTRLAGPWFGVAAAATYILLPLAGRLYFLPSYDHVYSNDVLPALVGLKSPGWLALGIALAIVAAFPSPRSLAVAGVVATLVALGVWGVGELGDVKTSLHEAGWSVALLEWLPVAGVVGVARRSPWLAPALGGWLVFFVLRASHEPFADGAFWRALAPALPAAAVLVAAIALLVPSLRPAPRPARAPRDAP